MASWGRALAAAEVLARDHPDVTLYRASLARAAHNLGTVQSEVGRPAEAIASYRRAAGLREALVRDHPDVPIYRDELAGTHNNLGNLLRDAGKPSEARHAFEQAVAIQERIVRDHPDVAEYRSSRAIRNGAKGRPGTDVLLSPPALPGTCVRGRGGQCCDHWW